jgi:molybdate transport system substrate-binding protein
MSNILRACVWVLAVVVVLGALDAAFGQETVLRVAAAADLTPVMPKLAAEYEKATGVKVVASFASSATLEQQLENGAPEDVFLSADFTHPEMLVAKGKTVEKSPVQYATGVLVLWARKDSPAQPLSIDSLTKPGVKKIAVANDLHAPYGVAAMQFLEHLHLMAQVKGKLVVAENIAQTAQFAESGNAQAGLISLTIANSQHFRDTGTFVPLPKLYPPIMQCGVVMKGARHEAAGVKFLAWLTSERVQGMLPGMGLGKSSE